ncbi:protein transport protein Sec24-like At3g07100 [Choloepus didactylus]|uniref:protein transport protein Sec24-like At3g07100 n=1 Tax=Choloepus didactylus TaxID=27675 RepID=UPI00189FA87F|nr:protein transport protein Sec24-like At3g07100 [Choloepus didactylus]
MLLALPDPGPPLRFPGSFWAQPGRAEKTRSWSPTAGTPTKALCLGQGGDRLRASAPSPTLRELSEGEGWGGLTRLQKVPCVRCPGDSSHSGANSRIGAEGPGLDTSHPRTKGRLSPPLFPPVESTPRGPPSLPARLRSASGRLPASLRPRPPLAPVGARELRVWRLLLGRQAPALPGFLFNNIAREAPAESARQNFLPGWGWAAAGRDNPRCPGFLSPLGRASAPGAETPPPPPTPPGILGHTWLEEEAAEPGWEDEGCRRPSTNFSCQISLHPSPLDPCGVRRSLSCLFSGCCPGLTPYCARCLHVSKAWWHPGLLHSRHLAELSIHAPGPPCLPPPCLENGQMYPLTPTHTHNLSPSPPPRSYPPRQGGSGW